MSFLRMESRSVVPLKDCLIGKRQYLVILVVGEDS